MGLLAFDEGSEYHKLKGKDVNDQKVLIFSFDKREGGRKILEFPLNGNFQPKGKGLTEQGAFLFCLQNTEVKPLACGFLLSDFGSR
jgi:hypothetical protein